MILIMILITNWIWVKLQFVFKFVIFVRRPSGESNGLEDSVSPGGGSKWSWSSWNLLSMDWTGLDWTAAWDSDFAGSTDFGYWSSNPLL